ncbi:alcohol dehydrogenase [Peniophora sp. CONT]|nr:alcohol dehydrogenase [Peniophora sp. CONT]
MTFVRNARYLFTAIPQDYPEEGQHMRYDDSQTIDIENEPLNGGVLVKNLVASLDPYLRTMMRDASIEAYVPAYPLGGPSNSHGVGVIVRSEHEDYKAGEHITCLGFPHQEYFVWNGGTLSHMSQLLLKIPVNDSLPDSLYLGVLGLPGQTAWMSWKDLSHAQKGQTVFISSAAGAVGSVVVQLAKRDGLKVIASSGSDEKVQFTRDCGADVSFNYKTQRTEDILKEHGPIDIYYDNVGGETLDLSLNYASNKARFIICGQIAGFNEGRKTYAFQNMFEIVAKEISLHGFLWTSLRQRYHDQFFEEMPRLVVEGKIKYKEDRSYGLDKIGEALLEVYSGANRGKKVVVIAEE